MSILNINWETKKRNIADIKPDPRNPRKIGGKRFDDLKKSVGRFGLAEPLVVNKDGTIIGGHARFYYLQEKGETEVSCSMPDRQLTEKESKELLVRLNKNVAGEFDDDMLANNFEIEELMEWGFEPVELGIDALAKPEDDIVPEVPLKPVSVLGDVYELGKHRILCGDSTSIEEVQKLMQSRRANMVFTDPPYNVNYVGKTKDKLTIENDKMTEDTFKSFVDLFIQNLLHFCDGVIYICMSSSEWGTVQDAFRRLGGHWSRVIIWVKNRMVISRADYHTQFEPIAVINEEESEEGEPILYGWKKGMKHFWNGGRKQTDIWRIDRPTASREHPTMKPVMLCVRAITNNSLTNDIVLDLFLGSGSTLIACEKTGRICYGMELDPVYMDVIVQRYVDFTGNTKIKKNGKEIEWNSLK